MSILNGKVALVTGASRGIGAAIATTLSKNGASVIINYAGSRELAETLSETLNSSGGRTIAVQADISTLAGAESLIDASLKAFGKIDILVNNAGIPIYSKIEDVTEELLDKALNTNIKGVFLVTQTALKKGCFKENGRIINISTSVTGLMLPTYSVYAATKGAVEQFTRHWAKELGPKGITVNTISPGPVATEFFLNGKTEEQIKTFVNMNSLGRLGQPDDIAKVILFIAGEDSGWVTGQNIKVNGGAVAS